MVHDSLNLVFIFPFASADVNSESSTRHELEPTVEMRAGEVVASSEVVLGRSGLGLGRGERRSSPYLDPYQRPLSILSKLN